VFRVLSRHAPEQRHRKHPAVVLPLEDVAGWAGYSPRTAKRALAALRVHGWITTRREDQPGRHRGTLDGRLRVELVMPPEVAAVDT
jgi:MarR-like DNA-binding transcriptional regulator SgrR of sgrS sRNA